MLFSPIFIVLYFIISAPPVSNKTGKYPESHAKSHGNTNGLKQHHASYNRRQNHRSRVEFDIPDFLQQKQEVGKSPVFQRHLRDPDPVIVHEGTSSNRGLLIPQSELEVPDFLSRKQLNGKVSSEKVNPGNAYTRNSSERVPEQQLNARTGARTSRLHSSVEELNMEINSHRHRTTAQQSKHSSRAYETNPNDATNPKPLHSRSLNNLHNSQLLVDSPQLNSSDFVDDFGAFSLKRKYKTVGEKERSSINNSHTKGRLAPGVTSARKYVVNPPNSLRTITSEEEPERIPSRNMRILRSREEMDRGSSRNMRNGEDTKKTSSRNIKSTSQMPQNGLRRSVDDDSLQSMSSLSYTDPSNSFVAQKPFTPSSFHFQDMSLSPRGYESPDSALGYFADSSVNNPDSSIDSGTKVTRQNSLQAQLRHRVQECEQFKQAPKKQGIHVRYDSDSTTISDQSIFGEGMSSVTRATHHSLHINSFQDGILLKIFSYLNTLELCKVSGVCRRWQNLAWDPILWNSIEILNYKESDINRVIRNLLGTLAEGTQGYCLTIHQMKLSGCELVSDKALGSIAKYCIDLEKLDLDGCCCITSRGLQDLLLNCHNLSHVNLSGCTCVNSISMPNANGFSLENNGAFLKLRHLDLSDCVAFDDFGLRTLGLSCGLLESLYLRRCSRVTDVGIKHIASHCHHLKELSTSDCFKVRDFSLKEIAKNAPGLKYLSVAKCPVSDTGIKYIGRHCVRLKYLNVRGCEAVTDIGLAYVVQNCLKLRSVDIGKCDVTDNVLHTIGIHCPQLKKLSIRGCSKLSDEGIRSIATQCCNLQYFNVQECNLSYETFTYIRQHCRNCIIEHTCPAFF